MNNFKSLCFFIGTIAFTNLFAQDVQISGYVVDITSGENIAKARVSVQGESVTASSYGFYSLSVPKGENNIFINATGFEPLSLLISVYKDKSFDFVIKTPPAAVQLLEAAKVKKGSGEPNRKKVAKVTWDQVKAIAEDKMVDLNAFTVGSAMKMVAGTARSMGITVKGGEAPN